MKLTLLQILEGNIKYKKVPYGNYLIKLPGQKWFAQDYRVNINSKTTSISIPMQQTGVVRGESCSMNYLQIWSIRVSANLFGFTVDF